MLMNIACTIEGFVNVSFCSHLNGGSTIEKCSSHLFNDFLEVLNKKKCEKVYSFVYVLSSSHVLNETHSNALLQKKLKYI